MLYLVATPIGNLEDITLRALSILKSCDYILCEDTRHTRGLLTHYEIQKPLKSYHKFSEQNRETTILDDLKAGLSLALVSDAGTPGISDPGTHLVQRCIQEGIPICSIPGACAAIAAITCSGMDTTRFQFFGFLPSKHNEVTRALQEILQYPGTTICYETPHRLEEVLKQLQTIAPERPLAIARELTKKFEEIRRGLPVEMLSWLAEHPIRGEIVLMIAGSPPEENQQWEQMTPEEHVHFLESTYQMSTNDAIKLAAKMRGIPKREVYAKIKCS